MTTLAVMKDRIARELRRSNITTQIAEAISTAIRQYQAKRWYFNETYQADFSTVAGQEFYDRLDSAALGSIRKIDYVKLILGGTAFTLLPDYPSNIESSLGDGTSIGMPGWYIYFQQGIRLYPVPADVWTIRVAGLFRYEEPASDSEPDNPWMIDAELLIRSRAKYELALHVLRDGDLANTMAASVMEATSQLKSETNQLTQRDNGRVMPFEC